MGRCGLATWQERICAKVLEWGYTALFRVGEGFQFSAQSF